MSSKEAHRGEIKPSDIRLTQIIFLIGCCCFCAFPGFAPDSTLNAMIHQAIPKEVAFLMLFLPFGVYYGISMNQKVRYEDFLRRQEQQKANRLKSKVLFRAQHKETPDGTAWKVTNKNVFTWEYATVLIEKCTDGKKETEKLTFCGIQPRQTIRFEAPIPYSDTAQWRVMVITPQGQLLDFPEPWLDTHAEKLPVKSKVLKNRTPLKSSK